jgi:sugar phosphate isomerase/epimerase
MKNIIVPLNAFNRNEVLEKGQEAFVEMIALAGAYGIEIRRELFLNHHQSLEELKTEIDKYQLFTVFSAPVEAWNSASELNKEDLLRTLNEAKRLGAPWVKVSLGHYHRDRSDLAELKELLSQHSHIQLFIENDQTMYGGHVDRLKSFFESAHQLEVPVMMTFDSGNWYYTKQLVPHALEQLAPYVGYLHLKHVEKHGQVLVTLPLPSEQGTEWRRIIKEFPRNVKKAIEFPIDPITKITHYIEMVQEKERMEGGEIVWNN